MRQTPLHSLAALAARALIAAGCVAALAGCPKGQEGRQQKGPDPRAPVSVTTQPVAVGTIQRTVDALGTLWGEEDTTISAKVAGRVVEIRKDVGDRANAGDVLAQLERTDYDLVVREKDMQVRAVLAKLNLETSPPPGFDAANVPTVQRAKLQADNALAKFNRGKQLHEQRPPLLSDQDFADLQTGAAVARSNYDVELLAARALLAEANTRSAELASARQRLADATVCVPDHRPGGTAPATAPAVVPTTAPGADTYAVAARMVSVGEYVKEGAALFRLVDDDPVKLRAFVAERFAADIQLGQDVRINVEAYPDDFWGKIARINPQTDAASRTFLIEVVVPNPQRRLKPGGFAKAWVQTRKDSGVIFVPRQAIQTFAGVTKVYVVRDGKAADAVIETGQRKGEDIEVVKGLTGKEAIIVSGLNKVAGGVPVIVRKP